MGPADAAAMDHNYIGMIERSERNPATVYIVKNGGAAGQTVPLHSRSER
jgi:hypothetical protein